MMNVRQELVQRGCLYFSGRDGIPDCQFIGVSGNHLAGYNNFDPALRDIDFLRRVTRQLVAPFVQRDREIGAVVTAATGSIPLEVLSALAIMETEDRNNVAGIWADKIEELDDLVFAFIRPGFAEAIAEATDRGQQVLIVEDMINRQFTIRKLISSTRAAGGDIAGVATIAANKGVTAQSLAVPVVNQLCEVAYDTWTPEKCAKEGPCSNAVPIVVDEALGHGAAYQLRYPDYIGGYINLVGRPS
jgi:orotate phosphoribosyltransferase